MGRTRRMALARMYTTHVVPHSEATNLKVLLVASSPSLVVVALTAPPRAIFLVVAIVVLVVVGSFTCGREIMDSKGFGGEEKPYAKFPTKASTARDRDGRMDGREEVLSALLCLWASRTCELVDMVAGRLIRNLSLLTMDRPFGSLRTLRLKRFWFFSRAKERRRHRHHDERNTNIINTKHVVHEAWQ